MVHKRGCMLLRIGRKQQIYQVNNRSQFGKKIIFRADL